MRLRHAAAPCQLTTCTPGNQGTAAALPLQLFAANACQVSC